MIAAHVPLSIFANMADDFEGHMIGNPCRAACNGDILWS
jgi:hypothetical protein